jgi:hypothetical protein
VKRAIVVDNVPEEYAFLELHYPDFRVYKQILLQVDGKTYDKLCVGNSTGEQKEFYFDISQFYGQEQLSHEPFEYK